jgi:2-dehydropantoate 2-reductase
MNIRIIGAGAIGLLLASKLAEHGQVVELMTRSESQAEELRVNGLIRTNETVWVPEPSAVTSFEQENESGFAADWIFLTVKQTAITEPLLKRLQAGLGSHTRVLCFQNGIGHVETIAEWLPPERIFVAVTTEGAKKRSGHEVEHTGKGTTTIGSAFAANRKAILSDEKKLADMLEEAGFAVIVSNQINNAVWNKLLINAVINPLTAVLRVTNGELLTSPHTLELMQALLQEGLSVAQANEIETAEDLWEQVVSVCRNTAANHSSMLQDMLSGRETEIEWINGSIIRMAIRHNLSVPVQQTLYRMVKAMEASRWGKCRESTKH